MDLVQNAPYLVLLNSNIEYLKAIYLRSKLESLTQIDEGDVYFGNGDNILTIGEVAIDFYFSNLMHGVAMAQEDKLKEFGILTNSANTLFDENDYQEIYSPNNYADIIYNYEGIIPSYNELYSSSTTYNNQLTGILTSSPIDRREFSDHSDIDALYGTCNNYLTPMPILVNRIARQVNDFYSIFYDYYIIDEKWYHLRSLMNNNHRNYAKYYYYSEIDHLNSYLAHFGIIS
ncbi:MAG: hypothetical protein INQ03_10075 [Candidatus Heimdallarchaeota archaeon]|nr:hypothetical protein [Candidatus Heimdallarchaeota archaeon]